MNANGTTAFLYLIARLITFLANFVLGIGVASTIVDWIPRPSIDIIHGAFRIVLTVVVLTAVVAGLILLLISFTEPVFGALAFVTIVVFAVPITFMMYHAATTVWAALPPTYAAQTSFLFLLAISISSFMDGGSED